MIRRRRLLTAALAAPVVLAGCANEKKASSSTASGSDAITQVKVSGGFGQEPKATFPTPLAVSGSETRVIAKGSGAALKEGQFAAVRQAYFNAADGKLLQSSWTAQGSPGQFLQLTPENIGPEANAFYTKATVGTRYAMTGQGTLGGQQISVIEVGDILGVGLARAAGAAKNLDSTGVAFTLGENGAPKLKGTPTVKAPATAFAQVAIDGTGATTAVGHRLLMHYTGWTLDGKQFDSSWDRNEPFQFTIGAGEVIKGWDTGLVGKKVGSQVLLVIPPKEAYGEKGSSQHKHAGETLIFVADILGAIAPATAAK